MKRAIIANDRGYGDSDTPTRVAEIFFDEKDADEVRRIITGRELVTFKLLENRP